MKKNKIIIVGIFFVLIVGSSILYSHLLTLEFSNSLWINQEFLENSPLVKSGDGSAKSPYVIENLTVRPLSYGIFVDNTNSYLKFQNIEIISPTNGIIVNDSSKIIFNKITIKNATINGVLLQGSNNIQFYNLEITDPKKHGIYFSTKNNPQNTFNNTINNSVIKNSGDTSIQIFGNTTKIFHNDILHSNFRSIFFHAPLSSSIISNNYIEDSFMEGIHLVGFKNQGIVPPIGRSFSQSVNVTISDNNLFNIHEDGIELQEGISQSFISGNYIHDSPVAVSVNIGHMNSIEIWKDSNHNTIKENTIENMGGLPQKLANGILIASSSFNTVQQNQISNVPDAGIAISWSSCCLDQMPKNNTITNNIIKNNPQFQFLNRVDEKDLSQFNFIS